MSRGASAMARLCCLVSSVARGAATSFRQRQRWTATATMCRCVPINSMRPVHIFSATRPERDGVQGGARPPQPLGVERPLAGIDARSTRSSETARQLDRTAASALRRELARQRQYEAIDPRQNACGGGAGERWKSACRCAQPRGRRSISSTPGKSKVSPVSTGNVLDAWTDLTIAWDSPGLGGEPRNDSSAPISF